jgi:spermidine/putrescine transport system permease protein
MDRGKMKQKWLTASLRLYAILLLLFFLAPILVILVLSFNDAPLPTFPFKGVTEQWFVRIFQDQSIKTALFNSLTVAFSTSVLAAVLGFALAYSFARLASRLKTALRFVIIILIIIPWITISLSSLIFYSRINVNPGLVPVIFTLTCLIFPYVTLIVEARLEGFPRSIEEAALDLGARKWQVAKDIYLPLISPTIFVSFLIAFILAFSDFIISYFLIGEHFTLPLKIFSMLRYGLSPVLNALSSLLIIVAFLIYALVSLTYTHLTRKNLSITS